MSSHRNDEQNDDKNTTLKEKIPKKKEKDRVNSESIAR
jgi:hypothetical protein